MLPTCVEDIQVTWIWLVGLIGVFEFLNLFHIIVEFGLLLNFNAHLKIG